MRYYPENDRKLSFFIGPQWSYLLAAKSYVRQNNQPGRTYDVYEDEPDSCRVIHKMDWGMLFGVDYELSNHLLFGLASNVGFENVFGVREGHVAPQVDSTNFAMQIFAGYNLAPLFE